MSIYRAVATSRITSRSLTARGLAARVVYMHLLAGQHTCQIPGLVHAGALAIADEANLAPADVRAALDELVAAGLADVDEENRLIRLPGVPADVAHQLAGRNNVDGIVKALRQMPGCPLRARHAAELRESAPAELRARFDPLCNPSGTPSEGGTQGGRDTLGTQEQEQEQEQDNSSGDPRARACEDPAKNALPKASTLGGRIGLTRVSQALAVAKVAERTGIPAATIRRIEADDVVPTRSELERLAKALGDPELASVDLPARDEGVVREVAGRLHDARAELGADEPRRQVDGDLVREVFAPLELVPTGMSLAEAWALVIPRAAEQARRNAEDGRPGRDLEFFTLAWLGKPERFRRFLANSALDQRREQPKPRGSPASSHVTARTRDYGNGTQEI